MTARIGSEDDELFRDPRPGLLGAVTGLAAESDGLSVMLDQYRIRSIQRIALSGSGDGVLVGLWPAELRPQADFLYGKRLGTLMVARARERGWVADANPHLAFHGAPSNRRLYLRPPIDAAIYAARWQGGDLKHIGPCTPRGGFRPNSES